MSDHQFTNQADNFKQLVLNKLKIAIIIAAALFLSADVFIPLLTNRADFSTTVGRQGLVDGLIFNLLLMLIIWLYLIILHFVESNELLRYVFVTVLTIFTLILPILKVWQLKYDFSEDTGFVDYTAESGLIPAGKDKIVNPLLKIPGFHASYLEGVEGDPTFRWIGIILIMLPALIATIFTLLLVLKAAKKELPVRDEKGFLVKSQYNYSITIFSKVDTFRKDLKDMIFTKKLMNKTNEDLESVFNVILYPIEFAVYYLALLSYNLQLNLRKNAKGLELPERPIFEFNVPSVISFIIYPLLFFYNLVDVIWLASIRVLSLGLYNPKNKGIISVNTTLRYMGTYVIIGLVFVYLSLDGFHGMTNFFSEPGFYMALGSALHIIYLSSDPELRNNLSKTRMAYGFILPTVAILIFELYVPIIVALFLSFQRIFPSRYLQHYEETITTNNVGLDNYQIIIEWNLIQIILIFVVSALVVSKVLGSLNQENNNRRRIVGKLSTVALWFSILYWTIGLNIAPAYEEYIATEAVLYISPSPLPVFINTVIWTAVCVFFHMIIGTTLGILMNTEFRGRSVIRAIMIIPWAVPNFITISIFSAFIFDNDSGFVNMVLKMLHLEDIAWMASENILWTSILVNIWLGYPFIMVSVLASLQSIPGDLYEAADIDGASAWQKFRYITLPMIKPTLYVISLLGVLWTFNLFNVIYLMTIDKQSILAVRDYYILIVYIFAVFRGGNWAMAATLSFILFLLIASFSLVYTKLVGKGPYELGDTEDVEDDEI
ncbi:MAG: sugar ABC transporter permease [Candidatus Heimdallarchaeota archaeon]|nr:sugar ABC transporter permease [Candidatus Heimdallarchaeota archaeon]